MTAAVADALGWLIAVTLLFEWMLVCTGGLDMALAAVGAVLHHKGLAAMAVAGYMLVWFAVVAARWGLKRSAPEEARDGE